MEERSVHSPDVDPDHLRGLEDPAQGPHEGPMDSHHLVSIDHVSLIEHDPDFLFIQPKSLLCRTGQISGKYLLGISRKVG